MLKSIIYICVLFCLVSEAKENKTLESQSEILFEHENLLNAQEKRELLIKFNTGVLYMEQGKYKEAISLFKESAKLVKIASYLNIGIAYYKLGSEKNAYLYLRKIYDFKELINKDKYSYFSAAYYLYKITKQKDYVNEITRVSAKAKHLKEHEKLLVVDTLIIQKRYKYALDMLKTVNDPSEFKIALLYIKLRDYTQAKLYLDKAYEVSGGDMQRNKVLWLKLFRDLKANDLINLNEDILKIEERKKIFHINKELKLELFFNKNKFTSKQYLEKITNPDFDRKMEFLYYFMPFIFEDYDNISMEATESFILKNMGNLHELNIMVKYNKDFLKVIKLDPIRRAQVLQDMIDAKVDTNSYEYYNLALAYAQIYDYDKAYKYFNKAYSLNHGNKLYSTMVLLTAKKISLKLDKIEKEFIVKNIMSDKGSYRFLGKYIYKVFEDPSIELESKYLAEKEKRSIFFRGLYFLENLGKYGISDTEPLLVEFDKDPLVDMLRLIARKKTESDYEYISRIQDNMPKIYNNMFLKGSPVITDFYIDTLRALGLFNRTDFNIDNELSPSYLRTKALVQLYKGNPEAAIKLIEYIQSKYEYDSVNSYYILAAAYFDSGQINLGYTLLSELEFVRNDQDAKFLSGIRLIQDKKLNTATQYFTNKLKGKLIDFKLVGFDQFLESL